MRCTLLIAGLLLTAALSGCGEQSSQTGSASAERGLSVDGVFAPCEPAVFGMLRGLEQFNLAGQVRFVGFDASEKLVEGLREKKIDALVLQDPVAIGYRGVKALNRHLRGPVGTASVKKDGTVHVGAVPKGSDGPVGLTVSVLGELGPATVTLQGKPPDKSAFRKLGDGAAFEEPGIAHVKAAPGTAVRVKTAGAADATSVEVTVSDVAKRIETPLTLVTPDNMDEPKRKKLLQPNLEREEADRSDPKRTFAVIPKGTTHEFWKSVHAGAIKAQREIDGLDIIWKGPLKESDRADQIQLVRRFIDRGVDGIVLAPLDAQALVRPVTEAVQSGIPVVIIDSGLKSDSYVSFVASNNYKGGRLAGRTMAKLLDRSGKVAMLRYAVGSASTTNREKGFLDALKKVPDIDVVSKNQYGGATRDTNYETAVNLLQRLRGHG